MHTSYFGNIKNLPKGKTVAISQGVPGWYKGQRFLELAPSWDIVRLADPDTFNQCYAAILAKLTPGRTYETIEAMVGGGAILLCWEKPGEFCHRRIVAQWFEDTIGIQVPEYERLQPSLLLDGAG